MLIAAITLSLSPVTVFCTREQGIIRFRLARVSAKIYVSHRHVCDSAPKVVFNLAERSKRINITGSLRLELSLFFRESEVGDSKIERRLALSAGGI
jgi:hypothetical protein